MSKKTTWSRFEDASFKSEKITCSRFGDESLSLRKLLAVVSEMRV
jgi:hypothetical protein